MRVLQLAALSATMVLFAVPKVGAETIDQCANKKTESDNKNLPFYLFDEIKTKLTRKAKICVTSAEGQAVLDLWDEDGEYVGLVRLDNANSEAIHLRTCWLGVVSRIDFMRGHFDKDTEVCVKVILEDKPIKKDL